MAHGELVTYGGRELDLSGPTSFPNDILRVVSPALDDLFASATLYRATGVILCKLSEAEDVSNLWICYPLRVRKNHQGE